MVSQTESMNRCIGLGLGLGVQGGLLVVDAGATAGEPKRGKRQEREQAGKITAEDGFHRGREIRWAEKGSWVQR